MYHRYADSRAAVAQPTSAHHCDNCNYSNGLYRQECRRCFASLRPQSATAAAAVRYYTPTDVVHTPLYADNIAERTRVDPIDTHNPAQLYAQQYQPYLANGSRLSTPRIDTRAAASSNISSNTYNSMSPTAVASVADGRYAQPYLVSDSQLIPAATAHRSATDYTNSISHALPSQYPARTPTRGHVYDGNTIVGRMDQGASPDAYSHNYITSTAATPLLQQSTHRQSPQGKRRVQYSDLHDLPAVAPVAADSAQSAHPVFIGRDAEREVTHADQHNLYRHGHTKSNALVYAPGPAGPPRRELTPATQQQQQQQQQRSSTPYVSTAAPVIRTTTAPRPVSKYSNTLYHSEPVPTVTVTTPAAPSTVTTKTATDSSSVNNKNIDNNNNSSSNGNQSDNSNSNSNSSGTAREVISIDADATPYGRDLAEKAVTVLLHRRGIYHRNSLSYLSSPSQQQQQQQQPSSSSPQWSMGLFHSRLYGFVYLALLNNSIDYTAADRVVYQTFSEREFTCWLSEQSDFTFSGYELGEEYFLKGRVNRELMERAILEASFYAIH